MVAADYSKAPNFGIQVHSYRGMGELSLTLPSGISTAAQHYGISLFGVNLSHDLNLDFLRYTKVTCLTLPNIPSYSGTVMPGPTADADETYIFYASDETPASVIRKIAKQLIQAGWSFGAYSFYISSIDKAGSVESAYPISPRSKEVVFMLCANLQFAHIKLLYQEVGPIRTLQDCFTSCKNLREVIISTDGQELFMNSYSARAEFKFDKLVLNCGVAWKYANVHNLNGFDITYPTTVYYKEGANLGGFLEDLPEAWTAVPFNDLSEIPFQYAPAEDE